MKKLIMSVVAIATLSTYASANNAELQEFLKIDKSEICYKLKKAENSLSYNYYTNLTSEYKLYKDVKDDSEYLTKGTEEDFKEGIEKILHDKKIKDVKEGEHLKYDEYVKLNKDFLKKLNLGADGVFEKFSSSMSTAQEERYTNLLLDFLALDYNSREKVSHSEKYNDLYLFLNSVYNESQQDKFKGLSKDEANKLNAILYLNKVDFMDFNYFLTFVNENKNNKKLQELFKVAMLKKYPNNAKAKTIADDFNKKPDKILVKPTMKDVYGTDDIDDLLEEVPVMPSNEWILAHPEKTPWEEMDIRTLDGAHSAWRRLIEGVKDTNARKEGAIERRIKEHAYELYKISEDSLLYKAKIRRANADAYNVTEKSLAFLKNENEKSGIKEAMNQINRACNDRDVSTFGDIIKYNKTETQVNQEKAEEKEDEKTRVQKNYEKAKKEDKRKICRLLGHYQLKMGNDIFTKEDMKHIFTTRYTDLEMGLRFIYEELERYVQEEIKKDTKTKYGHEQIFYEACKSEATATIEDIRNFQDYKFKNFREEDEDYICNRDVVSEMQFKERAEIVIFLAKKNGKEKTIEDVKKACDAWFGVSTVEDIINY